MSVQTSDLNLIGKHRIEVNASLVTYPSVVLTAPVYLELEIKICETTIVKAPTIEDVSIEYKKAPVNVQYAEF